MVAAAAFIGPDRRGAADHGRQSQHPEIAAVEAVGGGRAHQEQFALAQNAANRPGGERAARAVAREGPPEIKTVDGDAEADPADALPAYCGDTLEQRYACGKIAALGEQPTQGRRRRDRDALADVEAGLAAKEVKAGRDRCGRVPDDIARRRHRERNQGRRAHRACKQAGCAVHSWSALRNSQARCCASV